MARRLLLIIIISVAVTFPFVTFSLANEPIAISGASTIQPILEELSKLYEELYGVELSIEAGGSGAGIVNTLLGESDLGMVSRKLVPDEKSQLEQLLIGVDTIVFIVNEANPLTEITKQQIVDLYTGKITSWDAYSHYQQAVVLVSKEIGRSTLDIFEDYSGLKNPKRNLTGATIAKEAIEIGANIEVATLVGGIPNAIGYLSLGTALSLQEKGMPIKILPLDQVEATKENTVNGSYPILRELNVVYLEENETKLKNLLELLKSQKAKEIVENHQFISID